MPNNLKKVHFLALSLVFLSTGYAEVASSPVISPENPGSLQAGIDEVAAKGLPKIVIPPGTYRVSPQNGWHLLFKNLHDFEIDATGVTLILSDPYANGIGFLGCRNVTFRGARIQRSRPADSQATIRNIDPDGNFLDIEVDKGYPSAIESPGRDRS